MADDRFECVQFSNRRYPHDIGQWPELVRLAAYASRDRLLAGEPGLSVIEERSCCIDSSDERWPENPRQGATHALMFEVRVG